MKKSGLLNLLEQLNTRAESEEIKYLTCLEVLDLLLDYMNDEAIREAVERIPL